MALFGQKLDYPVTENLWQPRWLWPKMGEPRWRARLKARLTTLYFPCARLVRRTSRRVLENLLRWRRAILVVTTAAVLVAVVAIAALVSYRMWHVPQWVLDGSATSEEIAARVAAYRSSQSGVLGVLVQFVGGLALLAGLFFTWRQIVAGQEAQVSERFTRSVEQSSNDRVDVRVGGIQGLQRLANDRDTEFQPVLTLLTAFLLHWSAENKPHDGAPPLDVQMALTVLIRFQKRFGPGRYGGGVSLQHVDLSYAELSNVDFTGFDLRGATFAGAKLDGSSFQSADLEATNFEKADLRFCNFIGATLHDTNFQGANLSDALLRESIGSIDARGANLTGADLEWAKLGGDFRGATMVDCLCYETSFSYTNLEGVDLSTVRGLWVDRLTGGSAPNKTAGAKLPENRIPDPKKDSSGRDYHWRPGVLSSRTSIRKGMVSTMGGGPLPR